MKFPSIAAWWIRFIESTSGRGEEDITLSGIPWAESEKKCSTNSELRPHSQTRDAQRLILNKYSLTQENPRLRRVWSTDARLNLALKVGNDTEFRRSRSKEFQPVIADGKKIEIEKFYRECEKFSLHQCPSSPSRRFDSNCTAFFTTRIHSGVLDNPLILGENVYAHWIVLEVACLNNEMRSKTVIL